MLYLVFFISTLLLLELMHGCIFKTHLLLYWTSIFETKSPCHWGKNNSHDITVIYAEIAQVGKLTKTKTQSLPALSRIALSLDTSLIAIQV